ncbi:MAG TPA: DUF4372 domain-containing protein [Thermoanaerobaculia bacterium]|nr:DUF4372 domain-containing protein [Thermoanaerobaculia bacterium]
MVRTGSLFGPLLSQVSRGDFESLVARHGAERYSKGFSCWTQLVEPVDPLVRERSSPGQAVRGSLLDDGR